MFAAVGQIPRFATCRRLQRQRMLYAGDFDGYGHQIEAHNHRTLIEHSEIGPPPQLPQAQSALLELVGMPIAKFVV